MNVFRLVLCLAGLAIYLVVRQLLHSDSDLQPPVTPSGGGVAPGAQQTVPKTPRPQTTPHIEILKPDNAYAELH